MTAAIIVAAGRGTRMGPDVDKLFLEVAGAPVIAHTWQRFDSLGFDEVLLVVRAGMEPAFRELAAELANGGVKEIRGQGLMLGIDLNKPCGVILTQAADKGLLLSVTADSVVRLVPPLILTIAEADEIVSILCPLIKQHLKGST